MGYLLAGLRELSIVFTRGSSRTAHSLYTDVVQGSGQKPSSLLPF